jgi:hypothetical protein
VPLPECAPAQGKRSETVAALEARIDLIYRSRSWRYSYPIRAAGRLLRKKSPERPLVIVGGADAPEHGLGTDEAAIARIRRLFGGPRGPLRDNVKRYGWAIAAVAATCAITHLLREFGFPVPRMLLYIAAVAVVARLGGLGPGVAAVAASVLAICLSAPSLFVHNIAAAERLCVFLICAIVGILVSAPPDQTASETRAHAPPAQPHRELGG